MNRRRRRQSSHSTSTAAVDNGNGQNSLPSWEGRHNIERRGDGERKRAHRLKRVKTGAKACRKLLWGWRKDPFVQIALLSSALFSLVCIVIYATLHHYGGDDAIIYPDRYTKYNNRDNSWSSLLGRLRGTANYVIPDAMEIIGDKSRWYTELRREYDTEILPKDDERSLAFVEAERKRRGNYEQSPDARTPYDINNCPEYPPENYPMQWPVLDVTGAWPTDDPAPPPQRELFQGLCIFDYRTELHKANNYRRKEVPFVTRNDPAVARTAERWNHPGYMEKLLMGGEDIMRNIEYSANNHFMYWVDNRQKKERRAAAKELQNRKNSGEHDVHDSFGRGNQDEMVGTIHDMKRLNELKDELELARKHARKPRQDDGEAREEVKRLREEVTEANRGKDDEMKSWKPPTENLHMTYVDWMSLANVTDDELGPDNPHWYLHLSGCGSVVSQNQAMSQARTCKKGTREWLFDELPFFQPRAKKYRPFYLIEPKQEQAIQCRFGMKGVIAENHFDRSRNAITLLGGQRRYILAHPNQCTNMNLLPGGHPSARHSAVDWSDPDLTAFPTFVKAHVSEIVMQPGDVLYLPTNWFHYIVSLDINMQCNARSGGENLYKEEMDDCGFPG